MSDNLVTVVLPTYKGVNTLSDTIKSVQNQTFSQWELIIVDDNEPDSIARSKTEQIVSQYRSENIKYIQLEKNYGACFARNIGVDKATSEVIAFLDDDDLWYKDKLLIQFNELVKNQDVAYCVCNYQEHFENRIRHIKFHNSELNYQPLLKRGFGLCSSAIMVRKSAFLKIGRFDERLASYQDYDLLLKLSREFAGTVNREELLTYQVDNSGISKSFAKKVSGRQLIIQKYKQDFIDNGLELALAWQYENLADFIFINGDYKIASSHYQSSLKYTGFSLKVYFKIILLFFRAKGLFIQILRIKKMRRY